MARIRSVHPGLASDEAYMSMTMPAKAAWPLLWTEADDHGVFEWKPIVLKARIFPADDVKFDVVLAEYEGLGSIMRIDIDGKPYGVIRNFCKYQRAKNPSYKHPLTPAMEKFAGIKAVQTTNPPPVPPQSSPSTTEKPPQREEVRGRGDKESKEPSIEGLPISEAFAAYNSMAERVGLSRATKLSPQRQSKLKARLRDAGGIAGWDAALERVAASAYCRGEVNGFKADLGFLLQDESFTRLMEGKYDDRKSVATFAGNNNPNSIAELNRTVRSALAGRLAENEREIEEAERRLGIGGEDSQPLPRLQQRQA